MRISRLPITDGGLGTRSAVVRTKAVTTILEQGTVVAGKEGSSQMA